MSSKNPIVIRIPAVLSVRVDRVDRVLKLDAVDFGAEWFDASKEHACMQYAEISAGCRVDDFDLYIDEDGRSPIINDLASMLAAVDVAIVGDAFLATTPKHDEEGDETYTKPLNVDLVRVALHILECLEDLDTHVDHVEITFDGTVASSKDYWEPDIEGEKERRATGHSHLD